MPVRLFTGLPGNGKTAFMVEELIAQSKKGERPIFQHGIDGLAPGLATELANAKCWNAVDFQITGDCTCKSGTADVLRAEGLVEFLRPGATNPVWEQEMEVGRPHAHLVPDGALIFIDEAWRDFGHLHDASRQATPKHVLALAEHRHRGIDFVWTTQMPLQLYPFARALVAGHIHCVRRFGTSFVDVYEWQELNEEVKSGAKRENATKSTRALPKAVFDSYKSAEVHTIKARLPWAKILTIPAAVIAVIFAAVLVLKYFRPSAVSDRLGAKVTDSAAAESAPEHEPNRRASRKDQDTPWTVESYAAAHTPRISTLPWSAPIFDGRAVTADPALYCVASGAGLDAQGEEQAASCSCFTEQATPYAIEDAACRMVARRGQPYNPYRSAERQAISETPARSPGPG